jgi:AraC-like DNA-binding protein
VAPSPPRPIQGWFDLDPERESLFLETESLALGLFYAQPDDPSFAEAGQVSSLVLAFPRRPIWIEREGAEIAAVPGTCLIHEPTRPYRRRQLSRAGACSLWIALSPPVAEQMRADCAGLLAGQDVAGMRRLCLGAHRELLELEVLARRGRADCLLESRILALIAKLLGCTSASRSARRDRALVEDAKAYMVERLEDGPSLEEISRAVGTSPSYLCRLFSRHEELPTHRWRVEHRLHVALDRLAETSSLTDLAFELGFSSHSHFTSAFRQRLGLAPSKVRSWLRALRSSEARFC